MLSNIIIGKDNTYNLKIDPAKTIFWTGAGISSIAPSVLPLGTKLTDVYLKTALGPKQKDFVALWNNHFPQIRDSIIDEKCKKPSPIGNYTAKDVDSGDAWERQRFEYIIGEMDKLDRYFNAIPFNKLENQKLFHRGNVLDALLNFSYVEPCAYHYHLADLAIAGVIVITANFDDGIEKAICADSKKVENVYGTKAVGYKKSGNYDKERNGYVYHIHGIATDRAVNIGATIAGMSKGLDEKLQEFLCGYFENGYKIVFIGYGGVDFFDVEPFFRSLKQSNYSGKAIYLDYFQNIKKAE